MRGLLLLVLIAGLAWGAWWIVGSTAQKTAIENWFAERNAAGWTAKVDDLKVTGFPNRFDDIFTGLHLENDGNGWLVPELHIYALSYQPNHIIAAIPNEQTILLSGDTTAIRSDLFQGSIVFKPENSLALDRLQIEVANASLVNANWNATISVLNFAVADAGTHNATYKVYGIATEITPPQKWLDVANMSENITEVHLDATLTLDYPLDRFAVEQGNPTLTAITLHDVLLEWGSMAMQIDGALTIADTGVPEGALSIKARDWRTLLQIGIAAELIPGDQAQNWENGLSIVAELTGQQNSINAKLQFKNGLMFMGPIPLGPAPKF